MGVGVAILFAVIFVPLLFILGIKTGMDQSDKKWMRIMKENTTDAKTTIEKLQAKMKEKNHELIHVKDNDKELRDELDKTKEELNATVKQLSETTGKLKLSERRHCVHEGGLVMNDAGKYICPIIWEQQQERNKKFL